MLYDRCNIEQIKPDTIHKGQLLDIEKQSGLRIEMWDFIEFDISLQTELLIGEWP